MTFPLLTDSQEKFINGLIGAVFGLISGFIIEWYKKRKNPKESDAQAIENISLAANSSVITAKEVVELLEDRLNKEKTYYNELIERSKKECQQQILTMKEAYDKIIADLQGQIIDGKQKVEKLTREKNELQLRIEELQAQLSKYETQQHALNNE